MRRKPLDSWEKERFTRSKLITELCELKGIPVAHCLHASGHDFNQYFGYIYMNKCAGERLVDIWDAIDSQDRLIIARNHSKIVKDIHSIQINQLQFMKKYPFPNESYFKQDLLLNLSIIKERLLKTHYLNLELVENTVNFLLKNQDLFTIEPCLLHTDLTGENILIDTETYEISCILDWEWSCIGDPVYDLTNLEELFPNDKLAEQEFLNTYIHDQIDDFNLRKRVYIIYQQLETSGTGYYYHNQEQEAVPGIEKKIKTNLNSI